jgi:excisionase family DNA binding protein
MQDRLLTPVEVAALLRVRPQTVRDAVWKGKLPHVKVWSGSRRALVRFRLRDLEEFIEARTTRPEGAPRG